MEALIGRFRENYNSIDYDDINNFVKYRNSITHGRCKDFGTEKMHLQQ